MNALDRQATADPVAPPTSFRTTSSKPGVVTGELSVDDWIALPDHPRQRNTKKQSQAAHWPLARRATGAVFEQLCQVAAAELEGRWYKVNGHTRALLWKTGKLRPPGTVSLTLYQVGSVKELNDLYGVFDVQSAATTAYDQVYGAYREHGLQIHSKRLRHGAIVDALWIASTGATRTNREPDDERHIDLHEAVRIFKKELLLLDTVNPQPEIYYSGVVAAALIDLTLYPEDIEYFRKLSAKEGNKREGHMDPVEAVLRYVDRVKGKRAKMHQEDLCRRTLRAVKAWREGPNGDSQYWFKNQIHAMPVDGLLEQVRTKKAIGPELYL